MLKFCLHTDRDREQKKKRMRITHMQYKKKVNVNVVLQKKKYYASNKSLTQFPYEWFIFEIQM